MNFAWLWATCLHEKSCSSIPAFWVKVKRVPGKSKQSAYNLLEEFWFLNKRKKHSGFDFDFCCRQLIFGRLETIDATVNKLLGIMPLGFLSTSTRKWWKDYRCPWLLFIVPITLFAFCALFTVYHVNLTFQTSTAFFLSGLLCCQSTTHKIQEKAAESSGKCTSKHNSFLLFVKEIKC